MASGFGGERRASSLQPSRGDGGGGSNFGARSDASLAGDAFTFKRVAAISRSSCSAISRFISARASRSSRSAISRFVSADPTPEASSSPKRRSMSSLARFGESAAISGFRPRPASRPAAGSSARRGSSSPCAVVTSESPTWKRSSPGDRGGEPGGGVGGGVDVCIVSADAVSTSR